jgi:hypothetical protein
MASKIKVDNIENQCGGAVVTKCGATTTISGSVVKADDIQAADGGNLINQCGTTITLGASGDTITLACGASQTGFGRTGTVDWDTTAKTASFTAVSGTGYFVNTTSGAITLTLPASPSAGDIVAFKDYAGTFGTNNLTIGRNGSNLDGNAEDKAIDTNHTSMSLVYVDATQGWKSVEEGTGFIGENFMVACGGTETTCGDYKIHTFTSPGTFTVSSIASAPANNTVDYLVVAGGGAGTGNTNANSGGGGGAGGFRESSGAASGCYSASPLGACVSALPISVQGYPITVGGGGAGALNTIGSSGSNSVFSTITSTGGGRGGGSQPLGPDSGTGVPGGSGGGGGAGAGPTNVAPGGSGNTPPVSPPQGNNGGTGGGISPDHQSGGGGGAGGVGGNGVSSKGGDGGVGVPTSITGSALSYAGGGGGTGLTPGREGGASPCGTGGAGIIGSPFTGGAGTTNRGGGGGAAEGYNGSPNPATGGNGGSGVVIIRYKYQ